MSDWLRDRYNMLDAGLGGWLPGGSRSPGDSTPLTGPGDGTVPGGFDGMPPVPGMDGGLVPGLPDVGDLAEMAGMPVPGLNADMFPGPVGTAIDVSQGVGSLFADGGVGGAVGGAIGGALGVPTWVTAIMRDPRGPELVRWLASQLGIGRPNLPNGQTRKLYWRLLAEKDRELRDAVELWIANCPPTTPRQHELFRAFALVQAGQLPDTSYIYVENVR